jgi:transcription elongation factor GreA-like protein/transcription elongation GreA/GreB family factor
MGYLEEFQQKIDRDDYQGFLHIWEEYCAIDEVDGIELQAILQAVKKSRFASRFGQYAETALPLWEKTADAEHAYKVLQLILDLQTTNSPELADITFHVLQKRYGQQPYFNEKIRLIGLRNKDKFQGALSNYELLSHMGKGRFVYHTGGWGTGEIVDVSMVREELALEFDCVPGRKTVSFENAFKNLIPLVDDHFLARRFGNPDALEELARKDPGTVIRMLLGDLGPKTASEIKDELCDLVIPAAEWTKWWQAARSKIKKDTMIATPETLKEPFKLRKAAITHGVQLQEDLKQVEEPNAVLLTIYNAVRDFPEVMKEAESKEVLHKRLHELLQRSNLTMSQKLQLHVLLEQLFPEEGQQTLAQLVTSLQDIPQVVEDIDIVAFKKRVLVSLRETRKDWVDIFCLLFFSVQQGALRDYILKELNTDAYRSHLQQCLDKLLAHPTTHPQVFVWYFPKVMAKEEVPYTDKEGQCHFFEVFLMLLHQLEQHADQRELVKKMYGMLCGNRYAIVREVLRGSSLAFAKEFLLLVTKSQTLNDHDVKIMHSLAEVVHPSLAQAKKTREVEDEEEQIVWTTEEGFRKLQERMHHIGTVETVENAREIEAARALGDLRENSEYKFALERRSQLQADLKMLSQQSNKVRILTKDDINPDVTGVGTIVEITNSKGQKQQYTLLGPWDADPENNVLSFQSKFAQAMSGKRAGDKFSYQNEEYRVTAVRSFLEEQERTQVRP